MASQYSLLWAGEKYSQIYITCYIQYMSLHTYQYRIKDSKHHRMLSKKSSIVNYI